MDGLYCCDRMVGLKDLGQPGKEIIRSCKRCGTGKMQDSTWVAQMKMCFIIIQNRKD